MYKLLGLLLCLSILILLHELGHYLLARFFKTRVEKFYLFFNPYFSILRVKKSHNKWQFRWFSKKAPDEWAESPENTEWGLGWVPLGGYCAISGMIDETKTADQLPSEPQPWEYRSKKAWQRLLIISGGVITNFILALVIYSAILFTWGKSYLPIENATMGYDYNSLLLENGFQAGDIPLEVDGKKVKTMPDFPYMLLVENPKVIKVKREGLETEIILPDKFNETVMAEKIPSNDIFLPRFPVIVGELVDNMPAKKAGFQVGDTIIGINEIQTTSFLEFSKELSSLKNEKVNVHLKRGTTPLSIELVTTPDGTIGFRPPPFSSLFVLETHKYGFFESIPAGISHGSNLLVKYVRSLKVIFTKEGAKQIGGFMAIANLFPNKWDWSDFWNMTAMISLILAFMNILPIPALDGGHMMFTLFEMVTGRKPGEKFMERAQMVGMIILLALLLYANGNDIINWLFP